MKMKKHWGMQSIFIGITLIFGLTVFADQQPAKDFRSTIQSVNQLLYAMEETGAQVEQVQLHYGTAYKTYNQMEEVKTFAKEMGEKLGLTQTTNETSTTTSAEYHFQRLEQDVLTTLRIIAIPSHNQAGKWESYVTINMSTNPSDLNGLETQLATVYKGLESVEIIPQFNSCVQGIVNDKLENDVQIKQLNKLLDLLGAEVVEKVEDPTVKSYSAYSPEFPSYIWTKDKKMNVQAAMHVDQLHDLTRLTIGTPIITIEY